MPMPLPAAARGECKMAGFPSISQHALSRLFKSEQDFHQRRLAGAVFAADGVNLAGVNRERHAI